LPFLPLYLCSSILFSISQSYAFINYSNIFKKNALLTINNGAGATNFSKCSLFGAAAHSFSSLDNQSTTTVTYGTLTTATSLASSLSRTLLRGNFSLIHRTNVRLIARGPSVGLLVVILRTVTMLYYSLLEATPEGYRAANNADNRRKAMSPIARPSLQ